MEEPGPEDEQRARLDGLRRRLYRPGATDEDRERFEALAVRLADHRDDAEAPPSSPAGPRRRTVLLLVGATALLGAAAGAVPRLRAEPRALPSAAVANGPPEVRVARTGTLVQDLDAGLPIAAPGSGYETEAPLAVTVDGAPAVAQRFRGRGATTVRLGGTAAASGGRLVVVMTSPGAIALSWWAVRVVAVSGAKGYYDVAGTSDPPRPDQDSMTTRADWTGPPPTRLLVQDPGTREWTLTVVLLPAGGPVLR